MDIMRQSAYLVVIPITIYSYGILFNCITISQASDSITALVLSLNPLVDTLRMSLCGTTVVHLEVFFSSKYL